MADFNHDHFRCCFENWVLQQHQDLEELVKARSPNSKTADHDELKLLVEKGIKHFEEYHERRALLAQHHAPSFFHPTWCNSFETAFLWLGGCRPSLGIRLVYSVCGAELSGQLSEILRGERKGDLADISARQLEMINTLHCKTEEIADQPLAMIATRAGRVGEWSQELVRAMNAHSLSLASILADADKLRISTFKELMDILTPFQGVDLLWVFAINNVAAVYGVVFRWWLWGTADAELLMGDDQQRSRRRPLEEERLGMYESFFNEMLAYYYSPELIF
ncbi:protein DOG1-like 1 [Sesamum alatum]|uniref:Protein DOG1-like 1 n=1 Tax=Sesamum alatum TaxID=300844 RepID=A0AAE2CYW5_9LAMI|nr:protein DOG1-like 1 [Sesamum alatum]